MVHVSAPWKKHDWTQDVYMGPQIFWGHDIYLLGSRDVIGHVTTGLAVGGFL